MTILAQASPNPESVKAASYTIDPSHTLVLFSLSHFGFNDYYGTLPGATGTLMLDPR